MSKEGKPPRWHTCNWQQKKTVEQDEYVGFSTGMSRTLFFVFWFIGEDRPLPYDVILHLIDIRIQAFSRNWGSLKAAEYLKTIFFLEFYSDEGLRGFVYTTDIYCWNSTPVKFQQEKLFPIGWKVILALYQYQQNSKQSSAMNQIPQQLKSQWRGFK